MNDSMHLLALVQVFWSVGFNFSINLQFIQLSYDEIVWQYFKLNNRVQSPKNVVGALALPTGKFLHVREVFARIYKITHNM